MQTSSLTERGARRDVTSSARVLIWSPRGYERALYRCGQIEFEDVISAVDDVELVAPRARERGQGFAVRQVRKLARRVAKVDLSFETRLEKVKLARDYDLFFFYAQSLDDLCLLASLPSFREHCRKAVCLLEEVWLEDLKGGRLPPQLAKFDAVLVSFHGTVTPLAALAGLPCTWLPPGVDALRFFPGLKPPARTIDVFAMGRRTEQAHERLCDQACVRGWTYLFDTIDPIRVRDGVREHRVQLAELVKRSRYFVVNKARIGSPGVTADQEELGFRSFEGAAGGAIMIGHTPRAESVGQLFDWPDAHVHVPYEGADIIEAMAALDRQPERVASIRRNNIVNSLRRHDWAYRWSAVLASVGMAPRPALSLRLQRLEQLALEMESAERVD
jgi:hypothetical protein